MTRSRGKKAGAVREPLQVYLTADERALLDRLAQETGLSRAEVLRRGLQSFARQAGRPSPMMEFLEEMNATRDEGPSDMAERHDEYLYQIYREPLDQ